MDFKEVDEIIFKRVLVKILNVIRLTELLPYLRTWFDAITYQPIERCIENHGEAQTAATKFFDVFKCRYKYFPKLLAALKHTKQSEVYDIFIKEIRKFYQDKKNPDRCRQMMELIAKEERNLGIGTDADHGNGREDNAASGSGSGSSDGTGTADRPGGGTGTADRSGGGNQQTGHDRTCTPPLECDGATGTGPASGRGSSKSQEHSGCKIDPSVSGSKFSLLRYSVIKSLGKALEEVNADNERWWEVLVDNEDLEINWEEQQALEKSRKPGLDFLTILQHRNYTLEQLNELFARQEINHALQILLDNQNKVIPSMSKETSSNNLNTSENQKETPVKMNITGLLELSLASNVEVDFPQRLPLRSDTSLESMDNNTAIEDIVDESVKGTRPVQEHSSDRRAVEMDEAPDNTSDGNLPILNNLQSSDVSVQINREGEGVSAEQAAIRNSGTNVREGEGISAEQAAIRNSGTNIEAKPPRDGPDHVTGVNLVPASISLPDSRSLQNNAGSRPSESGAGLDEASNVTSPLPTVIDDSMPSYHAMNISSVSNESDTENSPDKPNNDNDNVSD